jgi:hypothetical protein
MYIPFLVRWTPVSHPHANLPLIHLADRLEAPLDHVRLGLPDDLSPRVLWQGWEWLRRLWPTIHVGHVTRHEAPVTRGEGRLCQHRTRCHTYEEPECHNAEAALTHHGSLSSPPAGEP